MMFLIFALSLVAYSSASEIVPLVLWHGMGDSCCNPLSLGRLMDLIRQEVPGIYVRSLQIGSDFEQDTWNGFFMNVNDQITEVCTNLTADANLKNGFNAMGFSQGGQFLRALVQRCPTIQMRNLISVGGQHQGVFGFPRCPGDNSTICDMVRKLLNIGAYEHYIQSFLVQAEYWQDPFNENEYRDKSVFLADINQENTINQDYKNRLLQLTNLVLVMFEYDTMVQPKESEWFGFYTEGQDKEVYSLYDSKIWQQDLLGLKLLNSTNRLHFIPAPFDHLQFTESWFTENLLQYFNVTF